MVFSFIRLGHCDREGPHFNFRRIKNGRRSVLTSTIRTVHCDIHVQLVIWLVENNSQGGKFHLACLASGRCGCVCVRLCSCEITLFKCWSHHFWSLLLLFFVADPLARSGFVLVSDVYFSATELFYSTLHFGSQCFFFFKSPVAFAKIDGENAWQNTILRNESKIAKKI